MNPITASSNAPPRLARVSLFPQMKIYCGWEATLAPIMRSADFLQHLEEQREQ